MKSIPLRAGLAYKGRSIPGPIETARTFLVQHAVAPFLKRPFLPRYLVFLVTNRCNARCAMCGIWKSASMGLASGEVTPAELSLALKEPFFREIRSVNLNGGEPTLREDLAELVQVLAERLPRLAFVSLNTNAASAGRVARTIADILEVCSERGFDFSASLSLHGVGKLQNEILGLSDAWENFLATVEALRSLRGNSCLRFSANCVLQEKNLSRARDVLNWCSANHLPVSFDVKEVRPRFCNLEQRDLCHADEAMRKEAATFLEALSREQRSASPAAFRYRELARMVNCGARRSLSCAYRMGGLILGAASELYYCPHSREIGKLRERSAREIYFDPENLDYWEEALLRKECLHCLPRTFNRFEFQNDVFKYLKFLVWG